MCDFLSAIITRDGTVYADGDSGHAELAAKHNVCENGTGKQRYWEWEWNLTDPVENNGLQIRNGEEPPNAVDKAAKSLHDELYKLNGVSKRFQWLAVYRDGVHEGDSSVTHLIITGGTLKSMYGGTLKSMYGGTLKSMYGGTLEFMYGGTLESMDGGTLNYMYGGTLEYMDGGTLNYMYGGTLEFMRGGTLKYMYGGTLESMDGGTLNYMDGGTLKSMRGGTLKSLYGGTLKSMRGGTLKYMDGGTLEYIDGKLPIIQGRANIITHNSETMIKLKRGSSAVLIDRSGDRPKCRVAKKMLERED